MRSGIGAFSRVFLIVVVISFLWPRYFFLSVGGVGISGFTLGTIALLGLGIVYISVSRYEQQNFLSGLARAIIPLTAMLMLLGWEILTAFNSRYPSESVKFVLQATLFGHAWIIIAALYLSNRDASRLLPIVTIACGFGAFLFGIFEFVTQQPLLDGLGLTNLAAGDREDLDAIAFASSDTASLRIKSVFVHPIIFGQVMALLSPLALHLIVNNKGFRRLIGASFLVATIVSIYLCQSRSPLVVMFAAMGIYAAVFYLDLRSPRRLSVFVAGAVLGMAALPPAVSAILDVAVGESKRDQQSNNVRKVQLAKARSALEYKPILGFGAGTAVAIAGVDGRKGVRTLDSFYIKTAVETGYVGLALFVLMQISLIIFSVRQALSSASTTERGLLASTTAMLVAANVGLLIISSTDAYFFALLFSGYAVAIAGRRAIEQKIPKRLHNNGTNRLPASKGGGMIRT
ncbi:O-antigen ligase family protein [Qipengyuania sp. GH38]|uniref:O-antigen ligase family protein n=1 Tax=Qipengyuania intermedia TaxID=2867244 RepID=UPI001C86CD73|nr:O-antigen ligase family protein [Qipengyuania intermedia]MBX7515102.1 O-antigen ligase family protein [Qipengyuania intermedia]